MPTRRVTAAGAWLAERLPDLAAAIDFDEKVAVLHGFDDPPAVAPAFDAIDSSGLTAIDLGVDMAVTLMDQYLAEGQAGKVV